VTIYRLGQNVPSPGVDVGALRNAAGAAVRRDELYGLIDLLSGGGLLRLTVFGLGVFPYIAAIFVVQLLTLTVPRWQALARSGRAGAAKIERSIWILAIVMSVPMGAAVVVSAAERRFPGGDVLTGTGVPTILAIVGCMTAGTAATVWLARLISSRGLGDGLGILFFVQLAAVFPGLLWDVREAEGLGTFAAASAAVLASALLVMVAVITIGQAERRVPIQHARKMIGVRRSGGGATYIPFRAGPAGLGPVFTALALLHAPALAARLWPGGGRPDGLWTLPRHDDVRFIVALFVLVVLFTVIGSAGAVDLEDVTGRLAREGAFVPGIRPGRPTAEYLGYVRGRVIAPAPIVLGVVAALPPAALAVAGGPGPVTGTCVLILVGAGLSTALRTARQADFQHQIHAYAPFLQTEERPGPKN
jgi:preprotein translocase subunit SecY